MWDFAKKFGCRRSWLMPTAIARADTRRLGTETDEGVTSDISTTWTSNELVGRAQHVALARNRDSAKQR